MNKRITSLLLCFVMVFAMLATAVPAFAVTGKSTYFKMTADKTEASPGDTVTYTAYIGPVDGLAAIKFKLKFPSGLTYVEGSGKAVDGLQSLLNSAKAEFTESTKVFIVGSSNYTSTEDTALMKFQCKVNDDATGSQTVEFYIDDPDNLFDQDYDNIDFTLHNATVNVVAAPKPATGISLNKTAATIYTGNTETLIATVEPTDTTDTVVWTSSKESVATVDNTGKVTAVAPGTATITAKAGDKTATCTVTVENAPCTHTSKTPVPAKVSTCEEKGWDAYFKCDDCGQLFDNAGNKIDAIPYLPLAAHSLTPVAAKAATCTENGNKAYYKCDVCGKWFEDATANVEITDHSSVVLTALGHDYTERIEDAAHKKATATDCRSHDTYWYDCTRGDHNAKDDPAASDKWYESTNAGPHSYDESAWGYKSESGHAHKCRYDDTHDTPVAHTPGAAATETTPQTCTECGYVITPALGHTHNMTPVAAKAATCTENGNKAYYVCSGCSKWFEDATGNVEITDHNSVVLTALGHEYTEKVMDDAHKKDTAADCRSHDTYWYDCTRGDHNAKDDPAASDKWYESTNAGPHSYDESAWGYKSESGHAHKCRYDDTHDTPVAHTPGAAATETTPQTCTECGYIITPALGHTHSMTKVDANPASCTEEGNIEYYKCDGCGKLFADATGNVELTADQVVVAATGHDYEWKIDKEATATEKGSKHEECKNCGDKKAAVEIPATGTPTTPTEPNKPADTKSPQTGDNSNMILWIALLFVSGGVLAGTTLYSRKRKSVK